MAINWERILTEADVYLIGLDIGCSSGRPSDWAKLGSSLKYLGIDPLESEIQRLDRLNESNSTYLPGFIDFKGADGKADHETSRVFERTSAAHASRTGFNSQKLIYNSGDNVSINSRKITIPEIEKILDYSTLDLLKIDIDGGDFKCLKGFEANGLLSGLRSLIIESQFHGDLGEDGNTLWNIGKLANRNGLSLYDLEVNRYSRQILPSRFVNKFPAQTHYGQALWGDALFINETLSAESQYKDLLRLIAVFEIHSFFDCALEILSGHVEILTPYVPVKEMMNDLKMSHEIRESFIAENFSKAQIHRYIKKILHKLQKR